METNPDTLPALRECSICAGDRQLILWVDGEVRPWGLSRGKPGLQALSCLPCRRRGSQARACPAVASVISSISSQPQMQRNAPLPDPRLLLRNRRRRRRRSGGHAWVHACEIQRVAHRVILVWLLLEVKPQSLVATGSELQTGSATALGLGARLGGPRRRRFYLPQHFRSLIPRGPR